MKLKKRKKLRRQMLPRLKRPGPPSICNNCGEELPPEGGHFFPPCFGEEGFFTCKRDPVKLLSIQTTCC